MLLVPHKICFFPRVCSKVQLGVSNFPSLSLMPKSLWRLESPCQEQQFQSHRGSCATEVQRKGLEQSPPLWGNLRELAFLSCCLSVQNPKFCSSLPETLPDVTLYFPSHCPSLCQLCSRHSLFWAREAQKGLGWKGPSQTIWSTLLLFSTLKFGVQLNSFTPSPQKFVTTPCSSPLSLSIWWWTPHPWTHQMSALSCFTTLIVSNFFLMCSLNQSSYSKTITPSYHYLPTKSQSPSFFKLPLSAEMPHLTFL